MRYLHTMVRVTDVEQVARLLLQQARPQGDPPPREREGPLHADLPRRAERQGNVCGQARARARAHLQLGPENYTGGRNFGHLAYKVDNIYETCQRLMDKGVTINRPPRDGNMAFVKSPDNISIELLQEGDPLPPQEPWASMPNTGSW